LRSLRERLPPNASCAWLRSSGIAPHRCALFHSLNQRLDSRFARAVATFHDLFVITGDYSSPEFRARFAQQARSAAARADLIIAVSRFTAGQVSGLLGVEPSRIRVIHHGVRPPSTPPPPDSARTNTILHVGALQKRKNLARLIEAFERTPPGWKLVLAGSQGYGAEEALSRIESSARRADIELAGYVDDVTLERMYAGARVFAFPSLDEGFGMPVLDAMARGVPVVTSNGSSLGEVADDAALLIEPERTDSIANALVELCCSEVKRQDYRERGLARASNFSWSKAVLETWEVYEELG
jgi:glycosyltransferase involved in cell wall biosynthesis